MSSSSALIPIVIGVTGHRNPRPDVVPDLKRKLTEIFKSIDSEAPNSPIIVLSPLATGCDQLAARIAVDFKRVRHDRGVRIDLVVPLPFPLADYRNDFVEDPASLAEFERLRALASYEFELPPIAGAGEMSGEVLKELRDAHYRRLGLFIALQSQLMVAMWDGSPQRRVGGTRDIIDFCQEGARRAIPTPTVDSPSIAERLEREGLRIPFRPIMPMLSPTQRTPLVVFGTPRTTTEGNPAAAAEYEARNAVELSRMCERISSHTERLNLALKKVAVSGRSDYRDAVDSEAWDSLVDRFERLDALASHFKSSYLHHTKVIATLAVLGICCFECFSSFGNEYFPAKYLMFVYGGLLFAALIVWRRSMGGKCELHFVESRGLAEAMRVQLAWLLAGIQESVADHYVARRGSELNVLQSQIRASTLEAYSITRTAIRNSTVSPRDVWVVSQRDYFSATSPGMQRRDHDDRVGEWLRRWSVRTALSFAAVLSLVVFVQIFVAGAEHQTELRWWVDFGCFVMGSLFALCVGIDYCRETALDREEFESGKRMLPLLARAAELLDQLEAQGSRTEVLRALGKEALDENGEWITQHRGRLRLPDSG